MYIRTSIKCDRQIKSLSLLESKFDLSIYYYYLPQKEYLFSATLVVTVQNT